MNQLHIRGLYNLPYFKGENQLHIIFRRIQNELLHAITFHTICNFNFEKISLHHTMHLP
jgi:hypothetical protein